MIVKKLTALWFVLLVLIQIPINSVAAVLPQNVISLDSSNGQKLFFSAENKMSYWRLTRYFVSQKNLSYSGVASAVMVLNALQVPAPKVAELAPYTVFNQENIFTDKVLQQMHPEQLTRSGATLAQMQTLFDAFTVSSTAVYADQTSLSNFREQAKKVLQTRNQFLIVNFSRKALGLTGNGFLSPIAAYDETSDRFLVLDVSRYEYPPYWVKASELWQAMNTVDSHSHLARGYVLVSKV